MKNELIHRVKETFVECFEKEPLLVFSPGRINLIGEHTDYNNGLVFPAAIDKGIVVGLSKSNSGTCNLYALDMKETYRFDLSKIEPIPNGNWKNYILGVIAEIQKLGLKISDFNCVFSGNIPRGSGMSSSAALENSIVFGLNKLFNLELTKHQMILISQKAEHNYVGVQCGIMDQYASMFGIENGALLLDCKTLKAQRIPIDFGLYEIVLINSNVKHELSESAYNDRHAVCTKVSKLLEKESLREVSFTDLEAIKKHINNEDYNKVLYVLEEIERVEQFAKSVEKQDLESMGNLLFQSHKGLSEKYKVSCNELDFLVSEAKKCDEVIGARMMGGGFGGCTINLVLKSELQNFENKISKVYQNKFEKACDVYKVKLSEGTRLV